jgi:hypothetical protein
MKMPNANKKIPPAATTRPRRSSSDGDQLHPVGEQLSDAVWNAARFALDGQFRSRRT